DAVTTIHEALSALETAAAVGRGFEALVVRASLLEREGAPLLAQLRSRGVQRVIALRTPQTREAGASIVEAHGITCVTYPVQPSELLDALTASSAAADREPDAKSSPRPASASDQREPLRILLAEDNPVNRLLAIRLLERAGHRVQVATNGCEAVSRFE